MNTYISFLKTVFNSKIGPIRFFKERRALKKSETFNTHYYSSSNSDLGELKGMPYLHYILFGRYESRSTCENYSNHFSDAYFYRYQLKSSKRKAKLAQAALKYQPLISIILFAGEDLSVALLKNSLNSICSQWYNHFEICLAVDKKAEETLKTAIGANHASGLKIRLNADGLADAYQDAKGEYIAIMRAGDVLAPDALFEAVKQVDNADADFIYSDEDKINSKGKFVDPFFKGGFSYEMLLSHNYIGFFAVLNRKIIDADAHSFDASFGPAESYDLYLKAIEQTDNIVRIPKVLYHKQIRGEVTSEMRTITRTTSPEYQRAVESHLKRIGEQAVVKRGPIAGSLSVRYEIPKDPLVSVIIPFKDKTEYLENCVKSILEKTQYKNYELILVSNNSHEPVTFEALERIERWDKRIRWVEHNIPFNYSKINNDAVSHFAKGEYLLFLNNDTVIKSEGWMTNLLSFAVKAGVAAVAPKMCYPNDTVQTAGITIGMQGLIREFHKFFKCSSDGYYGRLKIDHNVSAVSAACLMVSRDQLLEVGGFDEMNFEITLNDIDLCFRFIKNGYRIVLCPSIDLYHFESLSRTRVLGERELREKERLLEIYEDWINNGDPYFNPNFDQRLENFSIR